MADKQAKPKIVLLFPNPLEGVAYSLEAPLSILAVAAPLNADGYEVVLIDERLHEDPERLLLKEAEGALCVGISTMTGRQLKRAIHFSRLLKADNTDIPIIWGGYHPSLLPEQCVSEDYVDAVVRGQGEVTFREIIARLEQGGNLEGIAGVTFISDNGEIVSNPDRPVANVDSFPPAPYELLDIEQFFRINNGRRALQFFSSQGCPYKCTFCVEPEVFGKWTGRSAEKTVDEIAAIYHRYGIEHITFSDPNFFVNRKRVKRICEMLIERDIRITWSATARADQFEKVKPETARLLSRAGCSQISIGIESGSQAILDLIDKKSTPQKALKSNEVLRVAGIQGCYSFMVGFPDSLPESEDEVWQTLLLIKEIRKGHPEVVTITFYVTPYPGTPIFDMALKFDLRMPQKTEDWADWESTSLNTRWISESDKDLVERCNNLYFPMAYPSRKMRQQMRKWKWRLPLTALHYLASQRCRHDYYDFPLDWRAVKLAARLFGIRKAGSQIDLLRG